MLRIYVLSKNCNLMKQHKYRENNIKVRFRGFVSQGFFQPVYLE